MVAIFVMFTILAFLAIDVLLQRSARKKEALAPRAVRLPLADRFLIPRGYFLSRGHSWIELLFTGNARVGVDDFVQKLVGTVDAITLPPLRTEIRKGEPLFILRSGQRELTVPSPLSGTVVEVNPEVAVNPGAVNHDPYISGWAAVIEPTNLSQELPLFNVAESAAKWLRGEISHFRNFIKEYAFRMEAQPLPAGVTLLDGGMPVAGVLQMTDDQTWKAFEREFLCDSR